METIDYMNGRISFAKEIKNLIETAKALSSSEDDKYRYGVLIKHCEDAIELDEHFINLELDKMETEEMLNVR